MCIPATRLCECLSAHSTTVWFLACVNTDVFREVTLSTKPLITNVTNIQFYTCMHAELNPIQHEGGPYGPHTEELPDNSELARAGGPSFGDF